MLGVKKQVVRRLHFLRIKCALPMFVTPARCSDVYLFVAHNFSTTIFLPEEVCVLCLSQVCSIEKQNDERNATQQVMPQEQKPVTKKSFM